MTCAPETWHRSCHHALFLERDVTRKKIFYPVLGIMCLGIYYFCYWYKPEQSINSLPTYKYEADSNISDDDDYKRFDDEQIQQARYNHKPEKSEHSSHSFFGSMASMSERNFRNHDKDDGNQVIDGKRVHTNMDSQSNKESLLGDMRGEHDDDFDDDDKQVNWPELI